MRIPDSLPNLAIVRVSTAAGPFRVGQTVSLAFATPTVGRLLAHDTTAPQTEPIDGPIVPETMSATVTHAAGPYDVGDELTLSFIDARVARIHPNRTRPVRSVEPNVTSWERDASASDVAARHATSPVTQWNSEAEIVGQASADSDRAEAAGLASHRAPAETQRGELHNDTGQAVVSRDGEAQVNVWQDDRARVDVSHENFDMRPIELGSRTSANGGHLNTEPSIDDRIKGDIAEIEFTEPGNAVSDTAIESSTADAGGVEAESAGNTAETTIADGAAHSPSTMPTFGVHVRLQWNRDRVRRFIQVVDKLFTVGRLGWYRHALAMRLLIPDEVSCGDSLADIESMRHLHALRAAAVETLGRPLLAAFMPNFTVSTEWLGTIDSPAAARALAGLRDAVTPYVEDDVAPRSADAASTVGVIERRELLSASSASVEALLPVLIPTASPNAALAARLSDYRRMLIDVFGQTARSAETVRVHQMAQPNHALDDRLWQLVGAVGEAFDGLAVA